MTQVLSKTGKDPNPSHEVQNNYCYQAKYGASALSSIILLVREPQIPLRLFYPMSPTLTFRHPLL